MVFFHRVKGVQEKEEQENKIRRIIQEYIQLIELTKVFGRRRLPTYDKYEVSSAVTFCTLREAEIIEELNRVEQTAFDQASKITSEIVDSNSNERGESAEYRDTKNLIEVIDAFREITANTSKEAWLIQETALNIMEERSREKTTRISQQKKPGRPKNNTTKEEETKTATRQQKLDSFLKINRKR